MTVSKNIFYGSTGLFFAVVAMASFMQWWWLPLLPVAALLLLWAFEKPELLFYTLLAAVPWSVEYSFSDVLGTDFPDEPLMWLNAFVALALLVRQRKSFYNKWAAKPLLWLLSAQWIWALLTVFTSTDALLSLKYVLAKGWYLFSFVALPLLLITTKEKLKQAALVLAISMTVLVALTMVRHAQARFLFAAINESLAPFFRNHVNYSALLVCVIPIITVFATSVKAIFLKRLSQAALLLCVVALYFSYARGAWMAVVVGLIAYGLLKKKRLFAAFLITVTLVAASVFWLHHNDRYLHYAGNFNRTIFHTDFSEHLVATYQLKDMSTAERFYRWVAGARMVPDGWQTGFGPNTFYQNYKPYAVPLFKTWVSANEEHSTVHNYFLLLLIEQGVPGLLLFLLLLGVAFYTAQRLYHATEDPFWKKALAAVAVLLSMIGTVNFLSDLIETDKVGSVFYLCLSVLLLADVHHKKAKEISDAVR